jgi:LuxR family maltose regulon positive regulatory protein
MSTETHLRAGREALARSFPVDARTEFEAALLEGETAEALEGLGLSLRVLDGAASVAARERAFRLYQDRGDRRAAARVATSLAVEFAGHRSEYAVGDGWFQRARRLLEGLEPGPEHAWLTLFEAAMAHVRGDTERARPLAAEAAALCRKLGLADAMLMSGALEGLRLIDEGRVADGVKLLDEAATGAVTGEIPDPDAGGYTCCYILWTCERVRDFDRASQWIDRLASYYREHQVARYLTYCRAHYIGVFLWRGEWARAEAEIDAVIAESEAGTLRVGREEAHWRRAELRRLQGRWPEVEAELRLCEGYSLAHLTSAALALDQNDPARAVDFVDRFFRADPGAGGFLRASGEMLLARAQGARGDLAAARAAVARLRPIAESAATHAMLAELRAGEGAVAAAECDRDQARRRFEDALDLFARAGNPYATAQCRLDLAEVLTGMDRSRDARAEIEAAREALASLGAAAGVERAAKLLARLSPAGRARAEALPDGLSPRQCDVLRLLARGLSNRDIGQELFVSEFTVKRHVADILAKLDLPSRAAAAAYAVERGFTADPPSSRAAG